MSDLEEAADLISPALLMAAFEKSAVAQIMVAMESGLIQRANERACLLFGYHPSELKGVTVDTLIPEKLRDAHKLHRASYNANPYPRAMGADRQLEARRKNGTTFPAEISLSPFPTVGGAVVFVSIVPTTRKPAPIA